MLVNDIVAAVNIKLAGEQLTLGQMRYFLNEAVDMMNTELDADFPSFDQYRVDQEYDCIPDKYIRSVIICGAAYKFYEMDEEGIVTATQYQQDFLQNLFYMKRDYSMCVPREYQNHTTGALRGPNNFNCLAVDMRWL